MYVGVLLNRVVLLVYIAYRKKIYIYWLISSKCPRPNALMWSPGTAPQQRTHFTEYHQVCMNSKGINKVQNGTGRALEFGGNFNM